MATQTNGFKSNYFLLLTTLILIIGCSLDPSSESSVKSYLTDGNWVPKKEDAGWTFCGGCGSYEFNKNETFVFRKAFNNDHVNEYHGKWSVSKTGDFFADIAINFETTGEYTNDVGKSVIGEVGKSRCLDIKYSGGHIEYWNTSGR